MKFVKRIALLLTLSMVLSSCLEITVTNNVKSNGSVVRKVVCRSDDRKNLVYDNFIVPVDSSWTKTVLFEVDSIRGEKMNFFGKNDDTTWIYTYEKRFANVEGINALYDAGNNRYQHLKRRAEFEKKFRWFYSMVYFREMIDPVINGPDPRHYFTPEEYAVLQMSEEQKLGYVNDSDKVAREAFVEQVEEKKGEWMVDAFVEDMLTRVTRYVEQHAVPLPLDSIVDKREEVKRNIQADTAEMSSLLKPILGENPEALFGPAIGDFLAELEAYYESVFMVVSQEQDYSMNFVMPGKLIDGGSGDVGSGNTVQWNVTLSDYLTSPCVMAAESRVVNLWAWIVSALFVGFVVVGVVRSRKRVS